MGVNDLAFQSLFFTAADEAGQGDKCNRTTVVCVQNPPAGSNGFRWPDNGKPLIDRMEGDPAGPGVAL